MTVLPTDDPAPAERRIQELTQELSQARAELAEARKQQAATAETLRVISSSPMDLKRVFAEIAMSAARLCDAYDVAIHQVDGDLLPLVAHYGPILVPDSLPLTRGVLAGRAVLDRRTIQVADMQAETHEYPEGRDIARRHGLRTNLAVPLIRGGEAVGVITLRRSEVKSFTERQTELAKTFADQAVIAIENTRLFEAEQASKRELQESLEYQTATSDVLSVISRSPSDLQPVLNVILETAVRLCQADVADFRLLRGNLYHIAATTIDDPTRARALRDHPIAPGRSSVVGRVALERHTIHVPDIHADPEYNYAPGPNAPGMRAILGVPLLRDDQVIGVIVLFNSIVKPFTESQIALVTTFANQAVIAIENTRLFEEVQAKTRDLTEALEQQTATADVLKVISRSALDVQKVLDALVESAARLCDAYDAAIFQVFGDGLRVVAHHGQIPTMGPIGQLTLPLARELITGRAVIDRRTIQVTDALADADEYPESRKLALQLGYRTALAVPLVHAGRAIGVIFIRRGEVRPFTERQVELVTTFADQAVIAIENARLFEAEQASKRELQESLEYQTATSDVLNVISRSKFDLQPVLDSIVETAARLCACDMATIRRREGDVYVQLAGYGLTADYAEYSRSATWHHAGRGSLVGRVLAEGKAVQIPDVLADPDYTLNEAQRRGGFRSTLGVPLLRGADQIGIIVLMRREVQPFSDKQIELVTAFADQAVIAIENTRLFEEVQARTRELTETVEQQTATSEVLNVLSRSPTQLQPVLDAIINTANRLCQSDNAYLFTLQGDKYCPVAYEAPTEPKLFLEYLKANPIAPDQRGSLTARAAHERRTIHVPDTSADPEFGAGPISVANVRTVLSVPLLREGVPVGVITMDRLSVRPFSAKQIELVETFADQAVIAIENTRLFEEVQARNRDLTALGEVGRAVSSTLDLKVVLKTIVYRAVELSGTDAGSIFYFRADIGRFELGETTGLDEVTVARFRKLDITAGQTGLGESIASGKPLQVADITKRSSNPLRDAAVEAGLRAVLIVPLLGGDQPLGALVLQRRQPGDFPAAVVSLMQAFADQSAIALENARLFEEIARKSLELEIASEHKSEFVANMSHELRTPLAAMLGYTELLQEGLYGLLPETSLPIIRRILSNGKHLLGLINTVLDISKIEAGQFKLNLAEYALGSIVETVRVASESLASAKQLAIKTEVTRGLPHGLGDEQRLTQVLLNLVGNAIKFTDAGEVRIMADAANSHFALSVSDTGPGIPPEECERVFEKFRQVGNATTRTKGGTGLGLTIAREIVEMHGGRIWVESTMGRGSTFRMELPVRATAANSTT